MEKKIPEKILDFKIHFLNEPIKIGSTLKGCIVVTATQQIKIMNLNLRFNISEKVAWDDFTSGTTKSIKSKKIHYDTTYSIKTFNNLNAQPGTYFQIFSVDLPVFPDGSFDLISGTQKAKVKYTVKGLLKGDKLYVVKAHPLVMTTKEAPENKKQVSEINAKISIHSKGRSKMMCMMEKTVLSPGEIAGVVCQIDNSACRLNMRELVVRLIQKIIIKTTDMKIRKLEKTLGEKHFPGLQQGKQHKEPQTLQIPIPDPILPTTESALVECCYVFQVTSAFEGSFTNSMNIYIPIVIQQKGVSSAKFDFSNASELSSNISLSTLTPPGTIQINPLAIIPVPNSCRQLAKFYYY